jgi:hypothetical protein
MFVVKVSAEAVTPGGETPKPTLMAILPLYIAAASFLSLCLGVGFHVLLWYKTTPAERFLAQQSNSRIPGTSFAGLLIALGPLSALVGLCFSLVQMLDSDKHKELLLWGLILNALGLILPVFGAILIFLMSR